jgi:2-polyprenyl-3-methyl-5-hydroxy-6-metoxy-1,4-benzoquinol methylase
MKRLLVWLLWRMDILGTLLAPRLVRWTRKSPFPIHPKHFLAAPWRRWYLPWIHPGDAILDAGCGNAQHALACAKQGGIVFGFDRNARQLEIGKAEASRQGVTHLHLAISNVEEDWGFSQASFDTVIFLDVLEHLHQRERALAEVRRVLKPQGRLLLSIPQRDTSWKRLRAGVGLPATADPDHKHEYTLAEIQAELVRTGFTCEHVEPVVLDTWLAGWIDFAGGISFPLYRRLAEWKRTQAMSHPAESSGFRIVACKE